MSISLSMGVMQSAITAFGVSAHDGDSLVGLAATVLSAAELTQHWLSSPSTSALDVRTLRAASAFMKTSLSFPLAWHSGCRGCVPVGRLCGRGAPEARL